MAVLSSPATLEDQWDSSTPIAIPITTKQTTGLKAVSGQLVSAISSAATTIVVQLADAVSSGIAAKPFPAWVTVSCSFRLDSYASGVFETLTVSAVAMSGITATLTCSATTYAHAAGANLQIVELIGAAATTTFTFAPQQAPQTLADRGIVLELLALLDRALREGSATAA